MNLKKIISAAAAVSLTAAAAASTAMNVFAEGGTSVSSTAANSSSSAMVTLVLPLAIMFVLLYFMAIRPQKKQEQAMKDMQASIQVGDEVVTGGGIVGIVVSIGDDTVVIETGGAKHKLRIKNWAITENVTASERAKAAKATGSKKTSVSSAAVIDDDNKKSKKNNKDNSDNKDKKNNSNE